jgi:MFS family permease
MFLVSIGAAPAALGIIEGVSDAISSFSKLGAGWYSDRLHYRKGLAVGGYFLTGIATASFAGAASWVHVLIARTFAWFGRGVRGPVRDAILSGAVPPESRGRAFGFDRALDSAGAVLGPLVALLLVGSTSFRSIFLFSLIPGMLAALSFAFLVNEDRGPVQEKRTLRMSLAGLPIGYKKFLIAVAVFGMADFAHTLLMLRATHLFQSAGFTSAPQMAVSLYVVHNVVYAGASYPVGALADLIGKRALLIIGYALSGFMCLGFLLPTSDYLLIGVLFGVGGLYVAIEDSLERALAADLLPPADRGTGFGLLAATNGIGDFVSSTVVGILWTTVSAEAGFIVAAAMSFAGAVLLSLLVPRRVRVAG